MSKKLLAALAAVLVLAAGSIAVAGCGDGGDGTTASSEQTDGAFIAAMIPHHESAIEMAKVAQQALDAAGITASDLDVFIPHQANMRITDAMIKKLQLPESVVIARDIAETGNTSAASIPLAMGRMLEEGQIKSGDVALLIGFGAGLVYSAQVVVVP